jgi:hypothetical protein
MNRSEVIEALDEEINKLKQARVLIQGSNGLGPALARFVASGTGRERSGGRRNMSPEGRKRIAEAQRLRWAKFKSGK